MGQVVEEGGAGGVAKSGRWMARGCEDGAAGRGRRSWRWMEELGGGSRCGCGKEHTLEGGLEW